MIVQVTTVKLYFSQGSPGCLWFMGGVGVPSCMVGAFSAQVEVIPLKMLI